MDQPGKVANPARGQLDRENNIPLSPCVPENLVSRDGFSRPVPRQPANLHTQAESGAYIRDFLPSSGYNIGSTVTCRGKAHSVVILSNYINRHAGTPEKQTGV